jgi:hypothetical protein
VGGGSSTRPDPELILQTLVRLDKYLQGRIAVPTVRNPSLMSENLARAWRLANFREFRGAVHTAMGIALRSKIIDRPGAWRSLFGSSFPTDL